MIAGVEQRLPQHDMAAYMAGYLRKLRSAQLRCPAGVTGLAILVGEGREVSARVLLELSFEFVEPCH